ncbi:MAG TPA: TIGR03560 family F420-dependent LLM class oxidoreductase [Thermomicrobiales bacterium]|nr:TIGR03560 family F420-dependent LLM class oxidoreductase [Thermomicrobiales bacterium]
MRRLRFGFKTPQQHTTYEDLLTVWREADALPAFEHGWLFDHLNPVDSAAAQGPAIVGPCFEAWTLLTALATQTTRLRLGLMTACNTYRDPALHAQIAAAADVISGGRIDFGVGAGWTVYEHESRNIPLPPPGERIRRLDEAVTLAKRLWTEESVDFAGRYYTLREARVDPKPVQRPHLPVLIGGSGEQLTLRVVAKHADLWNYVGGGVEQFRHKVDVLRRHCDAVGRDFGEIELSAQVRVSFDDLPQGVRDVQALVDAGVTHVVLIMQRPFRAGMATRLAEDLIAHIHPASA